MIGHEPKFRLLSDEELGHLEHEFKQFLIVNNVYSDEWVQLNRNHADKALGLVALFSDEVLQRVYDKIHVIERHGKHACDFIYLKDNQLEHLTLMVDAVSGHQLSSVESIHASIVNNAIVRINRRSASLKEEKNAVLHALLESGYIPSTEQMWELLSNAFPAIHS